MTKEVYRPPARQCEPNVDWLAVMWRSAAANVGRAVTIKILDRDATDDILGDDIALIVEGEILLAFDGSSDDLGRVILDADFSGWPHAMRPAPEIRVNRTNWASKNRSDWPAVLWSAIAMSNCQLEIRLLDKEDSDRLLGATTASQVSPGQIALSHFAEPGEVGRALQRFDLRPDGSLFATPAPVLVPFTRRRLSRMAKFAEQLRALEAADEREAA